MTDKDVGIIRQLKPPEVFQYSYLSSFSGLEDLPGNYHLITYKIVAKGNVSILELIHENIHHTQAQQHANSNWDVALTKMKEIAERAG